MTTITYDPYAADLRDDPYPVYRYLRDEAPVYRHPDKGFFVVSRFADVLETLYDFETYKSGAGITLEGLPPDVQPEMITMDPPRHDELRALVKREFTPRAISALEPRVYEIARSLVAELDPSGFDLVQDVGGLVPSAVIAEMLGIPLADRPLFREWIEVLIRRKPDEPDTITAARAASAELSAYLARQIEARRSTPTDDLIGASVKVAYESGAMNDEELLGFVRLLLVAGNETTINLIGNAYLTLARHPGERARVVADPALTANAVEEVLRFESPVPQLCRTTTRGLVRHDVEIPSGSVVVMVFAAANRDEREFDEPDRFDVTRRVDRHLALGHGIHHCLGAALARLQARASIDAVLWVAAEFEGAPLALAGDSAGGNLAAVCALRLRGEIDVRLQALIYPVTDAALNRPTHREFGTGHGLSTAQLRRCWGYYLDGADGGQADASPLRADLAGAAPAYVLTAEEDILRDEGEAYAAALRDAGVPAELVRWPGTIHGFFRWLAVAAPAREAVAAVGGALRDALSVKDARVG